MTSMTPFRAWILGIAILTSLQVAHATPVGFVAASVGDASLLRSDQSSWALALVDQDVEIGDTARTGRESALKLILVDDTSLTLGEETELVIDEMLVGPAALREVSILRQLSGKLRVRVGEAFGGTTRLQVHTPTAVMGVKGSQFTSWVKRAEGGTHTLVCNTGGEVWVAPAGNPSAPRESIAFGKCRLVSEKGVVGPEIPVSDDVFPMEPTATDMQEMMALGSAGPEDDMFIAALLRPELPAVGVAAGDQPFATERLVEPIFEGSEDSINAAGRSPATRPNTAILGGAVGQPGPGTAIIGGGAGQP